MQEHTALMVIGFFLLVLVAITLRVLFCLSMVKTLKLVPEEHYIFPRWFVWMMLVPFADLVFSWIMIPFGIPRAFENAVRDNKIAVRKAKNLTFFGLTLQISWLIPILIQFISIPIFVLLALYNAHLSTWLLLVVYLVFVPIFLVIITFVSFVIYWIKVTLFRKTYLDDSPSLITQ